MIKASILREWTKENESKGDRKSRIGARKEERGGPLTAKGKRDGEDGKTGLGREGGAAVLRRSLARKEEAGARHGMEDSLLPTTRNIFFSPPRRQRRWNSNGGDGTAARVVVMVVVGFRETIAPSEEERSQKETKGIVGFAKEAHIRLT